MRLEYSNAVEVSWHVEEKIGKAKSSDRIPNPPADYEAGSFEITMMNQDTRAEQKEVAARTYFMKGHNHGGDVWAHNAYPHPIFPSCTYEEFQKRKQNIVM